MTRRLFLTGPIGCGKSTAIETALGERMKNCGGFLTRRYREPHLHFALKSPDGAFCKTFLDFSSAEPAVDLSVFSEVSLRGNILVLDEIGGMELLCPDFLDALNKLLSTDTPVLGVLKGEGPASAMIARLGLAAEYEQAATRLRNQLYNDPETLVYECGQFDKTALILAKNWVKEYCP